MSRIVIGRALAVSNTLGAGFPGKVYENALARELQKLNLDVRQQHQVNVHFNGVLIGAYVTDLLVEGALLTELKTVSALDRPHCAQCLNDLKATNFQLCLLLNFGNPKLQIQRVVNNL